MSGDSFAHQGYVVSVQLNQSVHVDPLAAWMLQGAAVGVLIMMMLGLISSANARIRDADRRGVSEDLQDLKRKARKTEEEYERERRKLSH
jgi:hypothetical protein